MEKRKTTGKGKKWKKETMGERKTMEKKENNGQEEGRREKPICHD